MFPGPVKDTLVFSLDAVRTDGWLERVGIDIPNFEALCELLGERVFAFAMILGVRITALNVDRKTPEATIVEFITDGPTASFATAQRLSLYDFRRQLVSSLLVDEPPAKRPTKASDLEGIQKFIGLRYLLLAPLYGYALQDLALADDEATVTVLHDGEETLLTLDDFRMILHEHLEAELERSSPEDRDSIDLADVGLAEQAAATGDWSRVIELLRSWPAPLAVFLRTPEGQMLPPEPRALVAKGLGLLGTALVRLGEVGQGEDIFRLAVQFAADSAAASEVFRRLGEAMLDDDRPGEAIGPLRRALRLGEPNPEIWPLLARAFLARKRYVAAFACIESAKREGANEDDIAALLSDIEEALGPSLEAYRAHIGAGS